MLNQKFSFVVKLILTVCFFIFTQRSLSYAQMMEAEWEKNKPPEEEDDDDEEEDEWAEVNWLNSKHVTQVYKIAKEVEAPLIKKLNTVFNETYYILHLRKVYLG